MIKNYTHANTLGKNVINLKLVEAPKIMHDPKSFLVNHFTQEHMKTCYTHQKDPNDSIYQGDKDFSEVVRRITSPDEKRFIFQHQHEIQSKVLHYIKLELTVEEKAQKQLVEKRSTEVTG